MYVVTNEKTFPECWTWSLSFKLDSVGYVSTQRNSGKFILEAG